MINKFEGIGIFVSIGLMALALFVLNASTSTESITATAENTQSEASVIAVSEDDEVGTALADALRSSGNVQKLIIDDVVFGEGEAVKEGDTVSVHYIGTLQNGQQFDNSYLKGKPFEFVLGDGQVIAGWDKGVEGMKVGGQRILVIPPELAYGVNGIGPIPGNATLVFAIELLAIK